MLGGNLVVSAAVFVFLVCAATAQPWPCTDINGTVWSDTSGYFYAIEQNGSALFSTSQAALYLTLGSFAGTNISITCLNGTNCYYFFNETTYTGTYDYPVITMLINGTVVLNGTVRFLF